MSKMSFKGLKLGALFSASVAVGAVSVHLSKPDWGLTRTTGSINYTVHRSSVETRTAPEAIQLSIVASGLGIADPVKATDYDARKVDIAYMVDWGDTDEPYLYVPRVPAEQNNRNRSYNPEPAHVYRTPGTYTVTLYALFGTNWAVETFDITVRDPDVVFAGDRTILCDPSGTFAGGGTYPGAQTFIDFDAALGAMKDLDAPGRLLGARGQSIIKNTRELAGSAYRGFEIGSFGPGPEDFKIRNTDTTDGNQIFNFQKIAGGAGGDIRFHDLQFEHLWNDETMTPQSGDFPWSGIVVGGSNWYCINNVTFDGFRTAIGGGSLSNQAIVTLSDVLTERWQDFGFYGAVVVDGRFAYLGCNATRSPEALQGGQGKGRNPVGNDHGPWRIQGSENYTFECCQGYSRCGWGTGAPPAPQPCIRHHPDDDDDGILHSIFIERSVFEGGGQVITMGNLNSPDNPALHAVIQYTYLLGNGYTGDCITCGTNYTSRSNILNVPGSVQGTGLRSVVRNKDTGYNAMRTLSPTQVYSCTLVVGRSVAEGLPGGPVPFIEESYIGGTESGTSFSGTDASIFIESNNIFHAPNASPAVAAEAPLSDDRAFDPPFFRGTRFAANGSFPAQLTLDPTTATPEGTASSSTVAHYIPQAGSAAIGSAVDDHASNGLVAHFDYFMKVRPGKYDPLTAATVSGTASRGASEPV